MAASLASAEPAWCTAARLRRCGSSSGNATAIEITFPRGTSTSSVCPGCDSSVSLHFFGCASANLGFVPVFGGHFICEISSVGSFLSGPSYTSGSIRVSETSAMPVGLRSRVPAKITSSMRDPRRVLADCSPSTQEMASAIFDLPQPFGPDDRRDAIAVELEFGAVAEGLESENLELFQFEQRALLFQPVIP